MDHKNKEEFLGIWNWSANSKLCRMDSGMGVSDVEDVQVLDFPVFMYLECLVAIPYQYHVVLWRVSGWSDGSK